MTMLSPSPGDLLMTRSDGLGGQLIREGASLEDEPNQCNHVAVVHHTDANSTVWCIEGRPGGVGWRDATDYIRSPWTVSNSLQPKSMNQRTDITTGTVAMIGTPYDWEAITKDAGDVFGLKHVWELKWTDGQVPGHVVCSSLAAYLYMKAGLACPPGDREVSPADWLNLLIPNHWLVTS